MHKVLTAAQMREVDRLTTERYGIPSIILMENAAHAVARVITEKLGGSVDGKQIYILCGKGNNGGDGAALARILVGSNANVEVFLFGEVEKTRGDARTNFEFLQNMTYRTSSGEDQDEIVKHYVLRFQEIDSIRVWVNENSKEHDLDCVVDALFGTGVSGKLHSDYGLIFDGVWFNSEVQESAHSILRIAVDIPSGLQSDTPRLTGLNSTVDVTVTFTAPKIANVLPEASNHNGELIVADIGSPQELIDEQPSHMYLAEKEDLARWLKNSEFSSDSYKNKRGHALLIGGSENYSGAAVLAGNAAMRSGVGLVTIGVPRSSKDAVACRLVPEVMVRPLAETDSGAVSEEAIEEIQKFSKNVDAIAIGSGLSANDESTAKFVRHFVENRRMPMILDADALTMLSPFETRVNGARVSSPHVSKGSSNDEASNDNEAEEPPLILTPHEGEFLKMLGTKDKEAIKDRVAAVREFSQKHNVILVLKGERALIGDPSGKVVVNPTGNSGLGKAGNGDTLTGILTGFVAQAAQLNIDIFETVVAAVYIAGMAGDIAEKKYGKRVMTASDVRECLTEAFEHLGS